MPRWVLPLGASGADPACPPSQRYFQVGRARVLAGSLEAFFTSTPKVPTPPVSPCAVGRVSRQGTHIEIPYLKVPI